MWTITLGRPRGTGRQPTSMPERTGHRWRSSRTSKGTDTSSECCPKIGLEPIRQHSLTGSTRPRNLPVLLRVRPVRHKWWRLALQPPALVSCRQAGNKDTHRKVVHTLSTTTRAPPHGWTRDDSSTLGCTAKTRQATAPSSNNQYLNLVLCQADGKCALRTLLVYISWTTTQRPQLGTIQDSRLHSTRTCRSTSATSGAS